MIKNTNKNSPFTTKPVSDNSIGAKNKNINSYKEESDLTKTKSKYYKPRKNHIKKDDDLERLERQTKRNFKKAETEERKRAEKEYKKQLKRDIKNFKDMEKAINKVERDDYKNWWKEALKNQEKPNKNFINKMNARLKGIYKSGMVNNDVLQEAVGDLGIDLIGEGYISTKEVLSEDIKESLEKIIKTPKKFDFEDLNKKALGQLIQETLDDFYDFYDSSAVWTALEEKLRELMMGRDTKAQQIAKEALQLIGPGTVKSMMSDTMRAFGRGELQEAKDLKERLWNMIKQHDLYSGNLD